MKKNVRKRSNLLFVNKSNKLFISKKRKKQKNICLIKLAIFISAVTLILFILIKKIFSYHTNTNININKIYSNLPLKHINMTNLDIISNITPTELRYNFRKIFENRKIYKYDNSYLLYKKLDKSLSYKESGEKIFESTGMLNFTMLDYYYNNIKLDTSKLNHIHIGIGLDNNYIPLTLITLISLLETSNKNTYIHLHVIGYNFSFEDMEKFTNLKKINKNIECIFYSTKQVELDFALKLKNSKQLIGDYSRLFLPHIVNNTDKLLSLDSGDLLIQKDLTELFNLDLKDNYFAWALDMNSGTLSDNPPMNYHLYGNAGVILVNCELYRKEEFYMKSIFFSFFNTLFKFPYQDPLASLPNNKVIILPLKYNCKLFYETDEEMKNRVETSYIKDYLEKQSYNSLRYSKEEIFEAAQDPVIYHYYGLTKIYTISSCNKYTLQFIKYAKLTGLLDIIKNKFPKPFENC